ncbi:MAG: MarR family transcriptional regulator [Propionibacterium sp.]|nr:MarR family transcriptional regulator [Propionibacterium sp.]
MNTSRVNIRLANQTWEAVMTAHARLTALFASEGVFAEVSMREYDVLYTLAKHDEPMRLSELQSGVLLSQPGLSRLVDRLVRRGLIDRCSDDTDRRAVRISLSERGQRVQEEVGHLHARSVARELGAVLDSTEMLELRRLASKLAESQPPSTKRKKT